MWLFFGVRVAYAVAYQLEQQGETVSELDLLASEPRNYLMQNHLAKTRMSFLLIRH
jgi:thioesterase domain-containing protein